MEGSIPYPRRTIWAHCNVLWTHEFPSYFPNHDECHLLSRSRRRMVISLHGWHGYTHSQTSTWIPRATHTIAPNICPQSPNKVRREQSLSQTGKMWVWERRNQIPRSNSREEPPQDEPKEVTRCSGLAHPQNTYWHTTIPRLHRLLSLLCTKLFCYSPTTTRSHKENHSLALGRMTVQSIQRIKNMNVLQPSPHLAKLQQEIYPPSGHISLWCGCHTLPGEWPNRPHPQPSTTN